jgi:hypothetical protein
MLVFFSPCRCFSPPPLTWVEWADSFDMGGM